MRISRTLLPILTILRCGGLNRSIRGWDRLLRSMFPLHHQLDCQIQTAYRGNRYAAYPNQFVDWQVLTTGGYELDDIGVLETLAGQMETEQPVVLDIGANVGHHTYVFASLGWRVLAFEPNPALWPAFEAKVRIAGFDDVALHKVGLANENKVLQFRVPVAENSGTGQFSPNGEALQDTLGQCSYLPVRRGDEYLAEHDVSQVDIVKIDVQGFEAPALEGLRETISANRPVVCVEIGDENRDTIPSLEFLATLLPDDYGFRMKHRYNRLMVWRSNLISITTDGFKNIDGNIFCIPKKKLEELDRFFHNY